MCPFLWVQYTGYTFSGWNTEADGSGTSYTDEQSVTLTTAGMTLYAQWTANDYNITNLNNPTVDNGTVTVAGKAKYGEDVTINVAPDTDAGYKLDSVKVNKAQKSTAAPIETVANLAELMGSYTYADDGRSRLIKVSGDKIIGKLYNGVEFISLDFSTPVSNSGDGGYTATNGESSLTFAVEAGKLTKIHNSKYNTDCVPDLSVKVTTVTAGSKYTFKMPASNVTVSATFTKSHTVTFNSNGGSKVDSQTVKEGGKATTPTAPTKDGYTFDGWYKDSNYQEQWTFATDTVDEDITLYAKWTVISYVIHYQVNTLFDTDLERDNTKPISYDVTTDTFTIPNPTSTNNSQYFAGWNVYNSGSKKITLAGDLTDDMFVYDGVMDVTIKKGSIGNIWLQATWKTASEVNATTVTTDVNSEVSGVTASNLNDVATEEVGTTTETLFVREELKIENADENNTSEVSSEIKSEANTLFTGVDSDAVEVKYLNMDLTKYQTKADGTKLPDGKLSDASAVIEIAIPFGSLGYTSTPTNFGVIREHGTTRTVFAKLDGRPSAGAMVDGTMYVDMANAVLYIYTQYFSTYAIVNTTATVHTVTLDVNGGNAFTTSVYFVASGATLTLPTPTRTNYTFKGWFDSASGGTKVTSATPITTDQTFYAQWTDGGYSGITYYTVKFSENGHGTAPRIISL